LEFHGAVLLQNLTATHLLKNP